jgi:hypothetical protein
MTTTSANGNGVHAKRARADKVDNMDATLLITPATRTKLDGAAIQDIEKTVVTVTIAGMSPLIVNNFGSKSVQQMEDGRRMTAEERIKAKRSAKAPVDPRERFAAARILNEDGEDCVPARWVKASLVTASKYPDIGIESTKLRGAAFVLGDLLPIKYKQVRAFTANEVYPLGHDGNGPLLRRDVVRVGKFPNKQPDLRYRPEYRDWSLDLLVEFEPKLIALHELFHLFRRAGSSVGLCEWRPEKSPAGLFGRFDLKDVVAKARQ